jgi:hypothetical protein
MFSSSLGIWHALPTLHHLFFGIVRAHAHHCAYGVSLLVLAHVYRLIPADPATITDSATCDPSIPPDPAAAHYVSAMAITTCRFEIAGGYHATINSEFAQ